jgi:hypothetical protein
MSTTNAVEKSIVVRAVQRRRYTDTDGRTVRRTIRFNGPILSSDLEAMKEGDQVTLWIEETPQTQLAIGSITTDEEHREQLAPEIQLTCRTPLSPISGMRLAAPTLHCATSRSKSKTR